jgi:UDP-glucuronate 4-epimerase
LNDFYSPALKLKNLACIRATGNVAFYQSDICEEGAMAEVFKEARPDVVIHLAARAGVRPSLEQPLLYERVNVRGTLVLLEACRQLGGKQFIFASSSSVYGTTNRVPFSEEDPVNRPISPYAATKIAGENLCYTYRQLHGIRMVCLRFFTVYGPRQRPDLAIRKFTDLIVRGKPITVFGDGSSSRDYTFIDDIVDGVVSAVSNDCDYEIFNLGNSSPVTLLEMIRVIEDKLGTKANIQWLPEQPGDVLTTYADISKANRLLGYAPRVAFADGIQKVIEWHAGLG